jgi:protein-tyrosine phosphatase
VLNLQADEDMQHWGVQWSVLATHYQRQGIKFHRVSIKDFDPVDLGRNLPDAVGALNDLLSDHHVVYVHCTAGAWRSPTVVIAYLYWCSDWDLERAIAHVKQCRACSPSLDAIRAATRDLLGDEAIRHRVKCRATDLIAQTPLLTEDHAQD